MLYTKKKSNENADGFFMIFLCVYSPKAREAKPGPEVVKLFSCSTQLGMKSSSANIKLTIDNLNFFPAKYSWA